MRTILKIIAAPFVLALILIVAVLTFLSCVAGAVCIVACVGLSLLAILCLLPVTRPMLRRWLGATVRRRTDEAAARWRGRARGPVIGQVVVSPDDERPPHQGGAAVEGRIIEPGPGDRP